MYSLNEPRGAIVGQDGRLLLLLIILGGCLGSRLLASGLWHRYDRDASGGVLGRLKSRRRRQVVDERVVKVMTAKIIKSLRNERI